MHMERLQRLADKIDGTGPYSSDGPIPPERWAFMVWWLKSRGSGCAIGHATQDPWFQSRGLHMNESLHVPQYGETINYTAIAKFFEITEMEALDLFFFDIRQSQGPSAVSKKIRALLSTSESIAA